MHEKAYFCCHLILFILALVAGLLMYCAIVRVFFTYSMCGTLTA